MSSTEKVVRDGKVAVLVSPDFGAGWSTWNSEQHAAILLYHPLLVQLVEEKTGTQEKLEEVLATLGLGDKHIYTGGWCDVTIEWLDEGAKFLVHEYDGSESLWIRDDVEWEVA